LLNYFKTTRLVVLLLLTILSFNGCSVRRMVGGAVNNLTDALFRQRDVQLAREGSASFLLTVDAMIQRKPDDPELLNMGTQVYSAYASAFLLGTDSKRAFTLFDQALDYGLRAWEIQFNWADVRHVDIDDWIAELDKCTKKDLPYLFWTANTWASWIAVNPESTLALADLSIVLETMKRIETLDSSYQNGAVHLFFGMYYAVQPRGLGRDLDKSLAHFSAAIDIAGKNAMLPRVLFARYYCRALFDEELFRTTLEHVLQSPSKCPEPNLNLMNAIARERAAAYLDQIENLF